MPKSKTHQWTFPARFRTNAFGWNGSSLACKRIKEAVSEIKKVTRKNPLLGAEGAVKLVEKFWPELQHVDSSSGALGNAVYYAVFNGTRACLSCLLAAGRFQELLELIESAPRISWHNRKYGVDALIAMGEKGEAIEYAKGSCGFNDNPMAIDRACEAILLSSELYDEAYRQ